MFGETIKMPVEIFHSLFVCHCSLLFNTFSLLKEIYVRQMRKLHSNINDHTLSPTENYQGRCNYSVTILMHLLRVSKKSEK
jgi:hypothetical protein